MFTMRSTEASRTAHGNRAFAHSAGKRAFTHSAGSRAYAHSACGDNIDDGHEDIR